MDSRRPTVLRRPPFDLWPASFFDPRYGFAWFCGAGTIVTQLTVQHATAAGATAYQNYEDSILRTEARDLVSSGGLFVIHDWRCLETHDSEARYVWQTRIKARPRGYLRGSIVCVSEVNPLLRMALQAATLVASITQGAKVDVTNDIHAALREHGVVRPGSVRPPSA